MTEFQKIEKCVQVVVAKPLAWAAYGLWRGTKMLAASGRRGLAWWRQRGVVPAARA
jgi:hypothetical protein